VVSQLSKILVCNWFNIFNLTRNNTKCDSLILGSNFWNHAFQIFNLFFNMFPTCFHWFQPLKITFRKSFECVILHVPNNYMHYPIKFTQNWTCITSKGETKGTTISKWSNHFSICNYTLFYYWMSWIDG
jgi:hypothetical protein